MLHASERPSKVLVPRPISSRMMRLRAAAAGPVAVHREGPRNRDEVLNWEEERVGQGDWTVACGGQRYQLDRPHEAMRLVRRRVVVRRLRNGRVQLVTGANSSNGGVFRKER